VYVFATRPRMHDTHDSDRREEEAWVEYGVKRNEGGREVERHGALKPQLRTRRVNDDKICRQYSHRVSNLHEDGEWVRAISQPH
jgi:hypothetical protein